MKAPHLISPLRQTSFLAKLPIPITTHLALRKPHLQLQPQRRTFLANLNPLNDIQTLSATRTLPHPSSAIYSIIADISSYSTFLPYCLSSRVTKTSAPDAGAGRRWPAEAVMVVGWGDVREEFCSRIYCVPERVVEAVGGRSRTTLRAEDIGHYEGVDGVGAGLDGGDPESTRILTHLLTRWTLRPVVREKSLVRGRDGEREQTEVSLNIEFQFANPAYGLMSRAFAPRVAEKMVSAFEKRIEDVMDGRPVSGERRQEGGLLGSKM